MVRQSRPGPQPAQILLTRPLAEAQRFADLIAAACPDTPPHTLIAPLLAPEFLPVDLPDRAFSALILTSATAVEALRRSGQHPAPLAFCVGPRTAEAARAIGLQTISAEGDAEALFTLIRQHAPAAPLLHLHGEETRGNLPERLSAAGIETVSAILYRQSPRPLSDAARHMLTGGDPVFLPVFSPRSGVMLRHELATLPATAALHLIAISQATAAAFVGLPLSSVTVALRPNGKDLLMALLRQIAQPR